MIVKMGLMIGSAIALAAFSPCVAAQENDTRTYDLPAQDLRYALCAIARGAGFQLIADPKALRGRRAKPLKGRYRIDEAVSELLTGTDLVLEIKEGTLVIRGRAEPAHGSLVRAQDDNIVVTGSRIRGAAIASKTTSMSRESMKAAGLGTLAEAVQTIPQNFSGGQNPGVGFNVPEGTGVGYGGASSINLRGLGSDATLTLLNGHRLAYNFAFQAIDISAIPFEAIDRIEVVADGSSALYGSDAVAGVANILLRRDFDGLKASARLGGSTDGGNVQQQYGLLAGQRWSSGGLILSGEFGRTTPILSAQRPYSEARAPGLYLSPFIKRYSLLASGHQTINDSLSLAVDALYNWRASDTQYAFDERGDVEAYGSKAGFTSKSFVLAPSLTWSLPNSWQLSLSGMIGFDRSRYAFNTFFDGSSIFQQIGCYCNKARSIEIGADGALFDLPGGPAKLALGGGYRINKFRGYRNDGSQDIRASQDAYFAYGEVILPVVGQSQNIGGVHKLDLTGALRYENYPGVDKVVTPKLGLIYAPFADVDLKASWGKSFRAPTLYQQFNQVFVNVYDAATLGGSGYSAGATAMLVSGGNPDLKPERAKSWSATLDFHPLALEGFRLEVSYFDVRYRDRIVTPIQYASQSLSNPLYADFINLTPSAADIEGSLSRADVFQNVAGGAFDPARIVAIVNNGNINVARQSLKGVDVSSRYAIETRTTGTFTLSAEGSYLKSRQLTSPAQPITQLSGTLFNPPKFRGRAGISWIQDTLGASLFANHTGALRDTRREPTARLGATTTFDLSARLTPSQTTGPLAGTDIVFGVQNIFNRKPPLIWTSYVFDAPYDSTNYGAVGRFVSLSLSKSW